MAAEGGLMIIPHKIYHSLAPQGIVVNSVGACDLMFTGFVGKYTQTHDILEAFCYGLACGFSNCIYRRLSKLSSNYGISISNKNYRILK